MTHTNPNEGCDRISDQSRLNTFLNAIYNSPQSSQSRNTTIESAAAD
jgi:hypothetical protein